MPVEKGTPAQSQEVQPRLGFANDRLSSLPPEVFHMIMAKIQDRSSIRNLALTSKGYHSLLMPLLHERIAVAATHYANISKYIRKLEPYLTIAQKQQLRHEGKYKGQQEEYSSHLDPNAIPACASHVRHLLFGYSEPGRKHQYIVHRYAEEVLKNLQNLKILETFFFTESMEQSIASQKNLQALQLVYTNSYESGAMTPLARIRNLKHLGVQNIGYNGTNFIKLILLNSASTLRSLVIEKDPYQDRFFKDWEQVISSEERLRNQKHTLTALKSLTLSSASFDATYIKSLQRAIDFMGLRELILGDLLYHQNLFLEHLTNLVTLSQSSGSSISLRSLCLNMSRHYSATPLQAQADLDAQVLFISAFNTLSSLELKNYNISSPRDATIQGLSDSLLRAILMHKNLTSLILSEHERGDIGELQSLSAATVAALVDNLSRLQHIEFVPKREDIDRIGEILTHGRNISSITCFIFGSQEPYDSYKEMYLNLLSCIASAFLYHVDTSGNAKFKWEEHCRLRYISVGGFTWELASTIGNPKRDVKKAQRLCIEGHEEREVWYMELPQSISYGARAGHVAVSEWVEKVAKDIS